METNWAGNLRYSAASVHFPESVEELAELVARLPRVKALGTRHSFSPVADSPGGALISLTRMAGDISIDPAAMTVTVPAAMSYASLAEALHRRGYGLANLASLPHISVVGGTATGTHGSGDRNGILATAIRGMELVKADGSVVVIDGGADLGGLAVGLGAFGIITRLTLEIQPTYQVRQDVYRQARWDDVLESFDEVMGSAYSVSLMAGFDGPTVWEIWQKSLVGPEAPVPDSLCGGTWHDDADAPPDDSHTPRGGVAGPWSERLAHFRPDAEPSVGGDELQSEYFVGRPHGVAALAALREMGDRLAPHLHGAEIRTMAADDIWLSPAYQRDSVCIGFTWRKHPAEVSALLPEVEAALEPFNPRPHWGKLFAMGDLHRRFPRLQDFLALRDEYDPTGKFRSGFVEEVLASR